MILRNDDSDGDLNDECVTRAVHIHLAAGSHEMVVPMRSYVKALLLFALLFVVGHAARLAFVPDAIPIAEGRAVDLAGLNGFRTEGHRKQWVCMEK